MSDNQNTPQPPGEVEQAQAVRDQQLKDYIGEDDKNTTPQAEPEKPTESKPEPEAPPTPEQPTSPEVPAFNPKEFEDNITQRVTDGVIKALTGQNESQMQVQSPWAKEGRNPKSYEEIVEWTKAQVMREVEAKQQEAVKVQEEAKKQQEEQEQKQKEWEATTEKETNEAWDSQWKELVKKDPVLKDKAAVKNFWQQINEFNGERYKQQVPLVVNLAEFYALHYKPYDNKVAGANAPIAGANSNATTPQHNDDYDWKTIRGAKSMTELLPKK